MDWYEMDLKGEAEQRAERETQIMAIIDACDEILEAPESTPLIKRCAIDNAYKRIVKIMKGETK